MIKEKGFSRKYLEDCKNGTIKQGLGINCPIMDQHIRWKQGQSNFILGGDNVGKTHTILWYFLCLSVLYDFKWVVATLENSPDQSHKRLIEMLSGYKLDNIPMKEIYRYSDQVDYWFEFIDHTKMYKANDLLDFFASRNINGALIDPYTGLERNYAHGDNYDFLNACRHFVNTTNKTLFTTLHPRTEGTVREFPKDHDMAGYLMPPRKAHAEGGQSFPNRADDFWILHRHTQHPMLKFHTELHVAKVKDTDTGGSTTLMDSPILLHYNYGLGFTINGLNPLHSIR